MTPELRDLLTSITSNLRRVAYLLAAQVDDPVFDEIAGDLADAYAIWDAST